MTYKSITILFVLSLLPLTGCNSGDPRHKDLVPASGTVLFNGSPIGEAMIVFHNDEPTKQGGSAISDANGIFTLRTFSGEGTFPGNYTVTVIKEEILNPISEEETARLERENLEVPGPVTRSLLPEKYRLKKTSDLKITIPPEGTIDLKIELKK